MRKVHPVTLVCNEEEYSVDLVDLSERCEDNENVRQALAERTYVVKSQVRRASFESFIRFLRGEGIIVNEENYEDLLLLAEEFSSHQLLSIARRWRDDFETVDADDFLEMGEQVSLLQKQIEGVNLVVEELNGARQQMAELRTEMKRKEDGNKRVMEEQHRIIEELRDASRQQMAELRAEMKRKEDGNMRVIEDQRRIIEELRDASRQQMAELRTEMKRIQDGNKRVMEEQHRIIEELRDASRQQMAELRAEMKRKEDGNKRVMEEQHRIIEDLENVRRQMAELRTEMKRKEDGNMRVIEDQRRIIEDLENVRRQMAELRTEMKRPPKEIRYCGDPLNGIIQYLTRECAENVISRGVVIPIKSSTCNMEGHSLENLVDFDNDSDFCSEDVPNQYVGYDFIEKRIRPTAYTLRTYNTDEWEGFDHLKSWVIETSNDNQNWTVIHEISDNSDLTGAMNPHTWIIAKSDFCQFIRVRQTGPNHQGRHYLQLSAFEVFGELTTE